MTLKYLLFIFLFLSICKWKCFYFSVNKYSLFAHYHHESSLGLWKKFIQYLNTNCLFSIVYAMAQLMLNGRQQICLQNIMHVISQWGTLTVGKTVFWSIIHTHVKSAECADRIHRFDCSRAPGDTILFNNTAVARSCGDAERLGTTQQTKQQNINWNVRNGEKVCFKIQMPHTAKYWKCNEAKWRQIFNNSFNMLYSALRNRCTDMVEAWEQHSWRWNECMLTLWYETAHIF